MFKSRPSAYKEEIVIYLNEVSDGFGDKKNSEQYQSEVITFARSFGIIQQSSGKEARLQRYSPTKRGRSLFAARSIGDVDFENFYTARLLFLADADSMMSMLSFYDGGVLNDLLEFYIDFMIGIREDRLKWLREAFREPLLFERIAGHLPWLLSPKQGGEGLRVEAFSTNTARHHATPRKGWLHTVGMLDRSTNRLTDFGKRAFRSLGGQGQYFWLGPPKGVQEALRIDRNDIVAGPYEDEFGFVDGLEPAIQEKNLNLAPVVASVMRQGFPFAKLVHASQASLQLPLEYIIYRSYKDDVAYDAETVLEGVFRSFPDEFDRLSALKGKVGFYRIK